MQNSNWEDANCIACMVKYMYIYGIYVCENGYMSFLFGELNKKKRKQESKHTVKHVVQTGMKIFYSKLYTHTPYTNLKKKRTNTKRTRNQQKAYSNNNNKLIVRAPIGN